VVDVVAEAGAEAVAVVVAVVAEATLQTGEIVEMIEEIEIMTVEMIKSLEMAVKVVVHLEQEVGPQKKNLGIVHHHLEGEKLLHHPEIMVVMRHQWTEVVVLVVTQQDVETIPLIPEAALQAPREDTRGIPRGTGMKVHHPHLVIVAILGHPHLNLETGLPHLDLETGLPHLDLETGHPHQDLEIDHPHQNHEIGHPHLNLEIETENMKEKGPVTDFSINMRAVYLELFLKYW